MEPLTKTEERVMRILWEIERGVVHDIIAKMPPPEPKYTTISSVVRILENKGFVGHKAYGRTYEYFPLISKAQYRKFSFKNLLADYFDGSYKQIVSFMMQEDQLDKEGLQELLDMIDQDEQANKDA